jgi:hypothetical protein
VIRLGKIKNASEVMPTNPLGKLLLERGAEIGGYYSYRT